MAVNDIFMILENSMQLSFPVVMENCGDRIQPSFLEPLVYRNMG